MWDELVAETSALRQEAVERAEAARPGSRDRWRTRKVMVRLDWFIESLKDPELTARETGALRRVRDRLVEPFRQAEAEPRVAGCGP